MNKGKIVSRSNLYDSDEPGSESENEGNQYSMPYKMEFEFIEVENNSGLDTGINATESHGSSDNLDTNHEDKPDNDEMEFPLFSFDATTAKSNQVESNNIKEDNQEQQQVSEETRRPKNQIMKVSLREDFVEVIKNERPISYYLAHYSDQDKQRFIETALDYDDIYSQINSYGPMSDPTPWKVTDITQHNLKIEQEKQRRILSKTRREGKKKRINKIICRERRLERLKESKKLEKQRIAKIKKKMFHKRGGKKNKKSDNVKPKYKTE
ncbi:uncharacterized protein RJT21DRAFT_117887 [Scheffersomyces amazonensis]|uniref:uncharacterized protein n=1 Tax=Scheffersomyces amazonensis TaxID=1078765 RepID=UPI00315C8409